MVEFTQEFQDISGFFFGGWIVSGLYGLVMTIRELVRIRNSGCGGAYSKQSGCDCRRLSLKTCCRVDESQASSSSASKGGGGGGGAESGSISVYVSILSISVFMAVIAFEPFYGNDQTLEAPTRLYLTALVVNLVTNTLLHLAANDYVGGRSQILEAILSILSVLSFAVIVLLLYALNEPADNCVIGCALGFRAAFSALTWANLLVGVYLLAMSQYNQGRIGDCLRCMLGFPVIAAVALMGISWIMEATFPDDERRDVAQSKGGVYGAIDTRVEAWYVLFLVTTYIDTLGFVALTWPWCRSTSTSVIRANGLDTTYIRSSSGFMCNCCGVDVGCCGRTTTTKSYSRVGAKSAPDAHRD